MYWAFGCCEVVIESTLEKEGTGKNGILPTTVGIQGNAFVTGIELEDPDAPRRIQKTRGVFIEIGLVPASGFLGDLVQKNAWGEIVVDKQNQTSQQGVWAAGDVTDVTEKQIAVAVGEGSKAALQLITWLTTHPQ